MAAVIPLKKYKQPRESRIWERNTQTLVSVCCIGQIFFIDGIGVVVAKRAMGTFHLTHKKIRAAFSGNF